MIGIQEALDKAVEDNRKLEKDLQYICEENKALRLLLNWAEECDFGFDQFVNNDIVDWEEFEEESKDMNYIESMIYYAKKYLENEGSEE
jgi:hypothetical protein